MLVAGGKSKFLVIAVILVSALMLAMLACSPEPTDSGDVGTATGSPGAGSSPSSGNSPGSGKPNGTVLPSFVDVVAPIESVEIVKLAAKSPNASLVIVSGGLNSCESFKDYQLSRDGNVFRVQVTNLRTVGAGIPCTAIYGMRKHSIDLPSDEIVGCETYQVQVNGVIYSVQASCPAKAGGPSGGLTNVEMVEVLAPILSADVLALESYPVQYALNIESALPNGCVEFGGYEVSRVGERIIVKLTNLVPANENVICTMEYRTVETMVSLGTGLDYEPATAYTMEVNGVSTGFVTDAALEPTPIGPALSQAFDLKVGETVNVGDDGLTVEFVELMEDSRCPSDVTCVWAGRAVIRVIVSSADDVLGFGTVEFTLEAGTVGADVGSLYGLTLVELTPYPVSTVELTGQDYVATLELAEIR